ncbi:hypothetical protein GCL60_05195 [Silvanigrella paludirubra]|jgi:transcriptional regulator with XRE-family HTH domain|uniref:Uncharacterized protein n=1 Tax=Silvanigrella paludirubra TaxID=2499159 RepID=A0A6N6VZ04_9BACT|nr:hypothetical protein [Silvanigrella paludirubra]KAB8039658.1 hypothetical protein GCL60_05195 [Silvanigrella paludirubra]
MDEVKPNKDEEKHIRTLSLYLEKFHLATGYQNKEVAELLNMDKSYYNKIRLKKFSPISNSISILKKFASLNDNDLIKFISEIEELNFENNSLNNQGYDWEVILKKVFIDAGPILRKILIEDRLRKVIEKNDSSIDSIIKSFILLCLIIDISKDEKWFNVILDFILNVHYNLEGVKDSEISHLIDKLRKIN